MAREATGKGIEGALNRIKIISEDTEVYPEPAEKPSLTKYKKPFSSNSTFVTFSLLLRAMLGPTILAIPMGQKLGGLAFAPPGFFVLLCIVTINMRRLILNAALLSERENVTVRTYDQVAYIALMTCSPRTVKWAKPSKIVINILFLITYMDACVIFMIFISRNVEALVLFYDPDSFLRVRHFIFFQVMLLMAVTSFRELKNLSAFSFLASVLLITVVCLLVGCYFLRQPYRLEECELIGTPTTIIEFYCVVLFCLSGISIALTLKSGMRTPQHFMSFPWIFYDSVAIVGALFLAFGILGYIKYGSDTQASVLLNINPDSTLAICVKTIAIVAVFCTCPFMFYVAFNVLWTNFLKHHFDEENVLFSEYFIRYLLIIGCFGLAMSFPNLGRMIVLKGAVFHTHLEFTIPPVLDYVTNYPEKGSGKWHCRLIWVILLGAIGITFSVSGILVSIIYWGDIE